MEATDSIKKNLDALSAFQKQAEAAGNLVKKMMAELPNNKVIEVRPIIIGGKKATATRTASNKIIIEFDAEKSCMDFFKKLIDKKF